MKAYGVGDVKFNNLPGSYGSENKTHKKCSLYKIVGFGVSLLSLLVKADGVSVLGMFSLCNFCCNVFSRFSNVKFSNIKWRNQNIPRYFTYKMLKHFKPVVKDAPFLKT